MSSPDHPSSASRCVQCGALLPRDGPGGHCAVCLHPATLETRTRDQTEAFDCEPSGNPSGEAWTQLAGYELYEEIGRGGMGVVYRARQTALNRLVAVKMLLGVPFARGEARERFRREALAAARLQHPGIVSIFDVGEDDGLPWLSMEYVSGHSLDRAVRERPLAAHEAARCVRDVGRALQHAHDHGVLHRDLKPSNILLDSQRTPRITDFGIARLMAGDETGAAELTRTGQMLGTPGYAAPEQMLRGVADVRTDVYGLGALLYHLLTARPPFVGPTTDAILVQMRDDDPIPPRRLNPSVPADLETICLKCLDKHPGKRYRTAVEAADDLDRFVNGMPIVARPQALVDKAWRWARRHPAITASLIGIGLIAGGTVAASIAFARHQADVGKRTSLISEARLMRQQRSAGSREKALSALRQAWAIEPSAEIRNEAISCLAMRDIGPMQRRAPGDLRAKAPDPAASGDGAFTASFDGSDVVVMELSEKREVARLPGKKPGSLLKLDDHGRRLAVAEPGSGVLRLLALPGGTELASCVHPVPVNTVDWSGDLIATGCDRNRFICIWDDRGYIMHRLGGHESESLLVSFRPRSQELASTANDHYIRLWHAARGVELLRRELTNPVHTALWWSDDGAELMAGTPDGGADVYSLPKRPVLDLLAPPQVEPHSENLGSATFSNDGDLAAVTDEISCRLWDFRAGGLAASFSKDPGQWLSARFAPDGRSLWLCGWDLELTSHNLERDARGALTVKASPPALSGHGFLLRDMSADGHALLLGHDSRGEFVVLWHAAGSTVSLSHPGGLAAAISPDASWAVTSSYKTPGAKIWSLPDGTEHRLLCAEHTVMQALITPGAQRLILRTGGGNFSFRTSDWTEEHVLPSGLRLTSMTASPDGRFLATLGDAEVRLHDARTFQETVRLQLPDHTGWLGEGHTVFDADGSHLLIHTALGSAVRWNLHALWKELERLGMGL